MQSSWEDIILSLKTVQSSANRRVLEDRSLPMSFIYVMNSRGPKIEP